jgi:hypothetical protein
MVWEWLKANIDKILESMGEGLAGFSFILRLVLDGLSTREQAGDVKRFFEGRDTEVSFSFFFGERMC